LKLARTLRENGETNADIIRQHMTSLIGREPLAKVEYVSIADADTLEELSKIERSALASLAVRIGKTRLIDNIILA
jgi:pantoate--beta-alanine ligase